jgi:hypothetical protein
MSKQLLREYFELCPDGNCVLDVLTEGERKRLQEGAVFLVGVCQKANTQNGNGRVYPKEVLLREVQNYQTLIKERRALGELDHPDESVINLKNASHLVTKMWWDGDNVMGKVEVLNTPTGKVLKELLNANVKLGISSRGMGSVREGAGEVVVEDDFQLICFDMVSEPSTPGAFLSQSEMGTTSAVVTMAENIAKQPRTKVEKINAVLDDLLKE